MYLPRDPVRRSRNQKRKRKYHHEGREEHEVYKKSYPKASCPSCVSWLETVSSNGALVTSAVRKFAQTAKTFNYSSREAAAFTDPRRISAPEVQARSSRSSGSRRSKNMGVPAL
jgi:hypothetical protein